MGPAVLVLVSIEEGTEVGTAEVGNVAAAAASAALRARCFLICLYARYILQRDELLYVQ